MMNKDLDMSDHASHRLRHSVTNQEPSIVSTSPPGETLTLLANALFNIVERQLKSMLACNEVEDATRCTILPGPKGDQGAPGPRGPIGEKGEEGDAGKQGERGEKGQLGFPGYKGEKGQEGDAGPLGPIGPRGATGAVGQSGFPGYKGEKGQKGDTGPRGPIGPQGRTGAIGPAARLSQNGCSWKFTDTCGHNCGQSILKRTTCPTGQYVAGFGSRTWDYLGRYNTHILCCPVT